jgi:hypothetical protein
MPTILTLYRVKKRLFADDLLFIKTTEGKQLSQPMRFFPPLWQDSPQQCNKWVESYFGLHWKDIDEDICFENFTWADNDPLILYHRV